MDSTMTQVAHDFPPFLRVYKDGRVERFFGTDFVPPSIDPPTGVSSKDVTIVPETGLSARIYIPKIINPHQKKQLPLLVYFHGGAFCIGSTFSSTYHHYLNSLVSEANVVAVSVEYRLAPEHPLPIAYDDSWASFQWVASHSKGGGPEAWLNDYADFGRVFLAGDSAGANIAHNIGMRAGAAELGGVKLLGIVLVHPYFLGKEGFDDKLWMFLCPSTTGCNDPLINPAAGPSLVGLGCTRMLVCVAEKDRLRERGLFYQETLGKSGWGGEVEIMESEGEDHVFHLFNPTCEKAVEMTKNLASFMNRDNVPSL